MIKRNNKLISRAGKGTDNLYRILEVFNKECASLSKVMINDDDDTNSDSSDSGYADEESDTHPLKDWHHRLGHLSASRIRHLARIGQISISKANMNRPLNCIRCTKGKSHHQTFIKRPKRTKVRTQRAGELVYSDTCGTFSVLDMNGNDYYQTYIDDYTRLAVNFLMKTKTETLRNFERYVAFMRARNYSLKTFRTDQGTEYVSAAIKDFLKANCIAHSQTGRSAHAQMHVAERMNRTLTEIALTMLLDAGLPKAW